MNLEIRDYFENGCGRCSLAKTPDCKVHTWQKELLYLRNLVLSTSLTEERKWGIPCYTYQGKNVLIVSAFKNRCTLSFFKGSLLKDEKKLLEKPGKNSQATRMFNFTQVAEIQEIEPQIKAYIYEAIEIEKLGLKVHFKKEPESIPTELIDQFELQPELKDAFYSLTPGKQRGYLLYFSAPKKSETKIQRIAKYTPHILRGEGMQDAYRKKSTH